MHMRKRLPKNVCRSMATKCFCKPAGPRSHCIVHSHPPTNRTALNEARPKRRPLRNHVQGEHAKPQDHIGALTRALSRQAPRHRECARSCHTETVYARTVLESVRPHCQWNTAEVRVAIQQQAHRAETHLPAERGVCFRKSARACFSHVVLCDFGTVVRDCGRDHTVSSSPRTRARVFVSTGMCKSKLSQ